jgi:hypothetical protein
LYADVQFPAMVDENDVHAEAHELPEPHDAVQCATPQLP